MKTSANFVSLSYTIPKIPRIMILMAQKEHEEQRMKKLVRIRFSFSCFVLSSFFFIKEMDVTNKQKKEAKIKGEDEGEEEGEAQLVIDKETSRHRLALNNPLDGFVWSHQPIKNRKKPPINVSIINRQRSTPWQ
jgi:hypothetical protein